MSETLGRERWRRHSNATLQSLNLHQNKVRAEGARALAEALVQGVEREPLRLEGVKANARHGESVAGVGGLQALLAGLASFGDAKACACAAEAERAHVAVHLPRCSGCSTAAYRSASSRLRR